MPNNSSASEEALTKIKSLYKKDLSAFSDFQNITDEYILLNREKIAEKLEEKKFLNILIYLKLLILQLLMQIAIPNTMFFCQFH